MVSTLILIGLSILLILGIFFVLGIKVIGKKNDPFILFFAINFFLLSMPGIIIVHSSNFRTFLNDGFLSVSQPTISYVTNSYFYSLCVLILFISLACIATQRYKNLSTCDSHPHDRLAAKRFIRVGNWLNLMFLIALFVKIGPANIPLVNAMSGDMESSYVLKAKLITGDISKLPESINQIFRVLIPLVVFMSAERYFAPDTKSKGRLAFLSSLLIASVYYSYELQKAPLFLLILGIIFLYNFHRGFTSKVLLFFPIFASAFVALNGFYFNLTTFDQLSFLIEKVLTRMFVMQNQGFYYIVEHFKPSFEQAKHGAIFSSYIFADLPEKADAAVMTIMWGSSQANVNMNTYFLGQAYSIGGTLGVVVSPFVIGIHLFMYIVIFRILYRKNIVFFLPLSMVFYLFFVPINQGFNSFLYARNLIFFCVFGYLIYLLYSYKFRLKRRQVMATES